MKTPRDLCVSAVERFQKHHPETAEIDPGVEYPPRPEVGDMAITFPLRAAEALGRNPREIAGELADRLRDAVEGVADARVDGPGFVNCEFSDRFLLDAIQPVLDHGSVPLRPFGESQALILEFVSANPTGPLHVGHGRAAVYGDALYRLLDAHGFNVTREYYVNDAGNQIDRLGESLRLRLREREGDEVELGEEHYRGDYLKTLAETSDLDPDQDTSELSTYAVEHLLEANFDDLETLGVGFDSVVRESEVATPEALDAMMKDLRERGGIYEEDGAVYLSTSRYGDDKDRVLIRSDGTPTYFANDLVYHLYKYRRQPDGLVTVLGHDHHGYLDRLRAGIEWLGHDSSIMEIKLYQLVNLYRGDEPLSMSTRAGNFVALGELIEEVGVDAVRFNFLTKSHNRPLDFDIQVATRESEDNPVYYVQYAHTRLCSILDKAGNGGGSEPDTEELSEDGHRLLVSALDYPHVLRQATQSRQPHNVTYFLRELASQFHTYYGRHRVIDPENPKRTARRLRMVRYLKTVFRQGLESLGVQAPESM